MSLEAQLEQLNENIARGCELLEKLIAASAPVKATTTSDKPEKVKDKPAAKEKQKPVAEEPKDKPAAESTGKAEPAAGLDYEADVKPYVLANAKEHREEIVGILGRFGCKKATELGASQYSEFLARLKNAIENGLESDTEFAGAE